MPIDSITVRVTDGLKTGEYAPNKVYDLTAIISNPGDGDVDRAITLLSGAGERFLGRAPSATPAVPAVPAAPEAPRRGRPPKSAAPPPPAETPANPAEITDETPPAETPAANPADLSDVLGDEPAAPEITDAELTSATTRKNGELANPSAVRALIQTFKPADAGDKVMRLVEIPQERRREYLDKLAALAKS